MIPIKEEQMHRIKKSSSYLCMVFFVFYENMFFLFEALFF